MLNNGAMKIVALGLVLASFAFSSSNALAKEGGAWDFEGHPADPAAQLILLATQASVGEKGCEASKLEVLVRQIVKGNPEVLPVPESASEDLTPSEWECLKDVVSKISDTQ